MLLGTDRGLYPTISSKKLIDCSVYHPQSSRRFHQISNVNFLSNPTNTHSQTNADENNNNDDDDDDGDDDDNNEI